MKITAMAGMVMAVAMSAGADELTVYVTGLSVVPARVLNRAQALANEMFAAADVKIDWRRGEPSSRSRQERAVVVEMVMLTPIERRPGALAFAFPYEGVHITVFYDRVEAATEAELTPNVLAHVMVHEITHILQGSCRHSDTGVMKAQWTHPDYMQMGQKPLPFTEEDLQLIRNGLARRTETGTMLAARLLPINRGRK
jgi:hypothetical protein